MHPATTAALARYLAAVVALNLAWEVGQMPLYTLWTSGSAGDIAFALLHCTAGDAVIAAGAIVLAWLVAGRPAWPNERFLAVAALAVAGGLAYTVWSEWHNVYVAQTWAYAPAMPTVLGIGLAPVVQWSLIPPAAMALVLGYARRDAAPGSTQGRTND